MEFHSETPAAKEQSSPSGYPGVPGNTNYLRKPPGLSVHLVLQVQVSVVLVNPPAEYMHTRFV